MATDIRESDRMSDEELLGQITTLLAAGHETTSTLTTWFLHTIAHPENQHVYTKLRDEVEDYFAGRDEIGYDALMSMPYLDNVTKEILRMCILRSHILQRLTCNLLCRIPCTCHNNGKIRAQR